MTRRTASMVAGVGVLLVVVALIVLQLVLPGIARSRVRDEVGDSSAKVTVKASPALKLLLGKADEVDVDSPTIAGSQEAPLGKLLRRAKDVDVIDSHVGRVLVQGLTLRDMHAVVRDGRFDATASLSIKALAQMVPGGGTLKPLAPGAQGQPRFAVTVGLLGIGATVDGVIAADDGAVKATAEGLPLPLSITVFSDPAVAVESVRGRATGDTLRIAFSGLVR